MDSKKRVRLTETDIEAIADRVYKMLLRKEKVVQLHQDTVSPEKDMVTAKEAARLLGLSATYMLTIKDRFRYVKLGDNKQCRVLFYKEDILEKISQYEK